MKFAEFPPKDIVRLLLSFVYIERYPLNFVRKLFNPYFLDRIHDHAMEDVHLARHYLTLFDVAMNIDSPVYGGKKNFFLIKSCKEIKRLVFCTKCLWKEVGPGKETH